MYCIFALMISGFMTGISALSIVGGVLMVIFFFTVSLKYMTVSRKVKAAMLSGKAEFSGSKFSLKNPLRTTIKKDKLTEIEPAASDKTIPPVIRMEEDNRPRSIKFKFILVSVGTVAMFLIAAIVSTFLSEKATKSIRSGIQNINELSLPTLKLYNVLGVKIKSPAAFAETDVGLTAAQKIEMGIVSSESFISTYSKKDPNDHEIIISSVFRQIHEPNITFDTKTARIETANKWKNSIKLSDIQEQTNLVSIDNREFRRTMISGLMDGRGPIMEISLLTYHNDSTMWMITVVNNKRYHSTTDEMIQSISFINDN